MKILKALTLLLTTLSFALSAFVPPQKPTKAGVLDVLPAELRLEQVKAIASPPLSLKQAVANIKQYYIAHPPSRQSVEITKGILTHLMNEYNFDSNALERVVDALAKRETMIVFKNPEMKQWIQAQKDRLDNEEEFGRAIYRKDIKIMKELLAQGVNVNAKLGVRGTPLEIAMIEEKHLNDPQELAKYTDVLTILLNAGANPNGSAGFPLRHAVSRGLPSTVKLLLQAGADPNINPYTTQGSPLAIAAFQLITQIHGVHARWRETFVPEYTEIIKMLLAAGSKLDTPGTFLQGTSYANIRDLINSRSEFTRKEKAEALAIIYAGQQ